MFNLKGMTNFQLRVWKEVLKIPLGCVRDYSWIARRIGSPRAVRAVGTALKNNPYPILIPCHRVVQSNGEIGGYSRGREVKKKLIQLENQQKNIFCLNRKKVVSFNKEKSAGRKQIWGNSLASGSARRCHCEPRRGAAI